MIGTDCTGSCKSNYHTITTTTYWRHEENVLDYIPSFVQMDWRLMDFSLYNCLWKSRSSACYLYKTCKCKQILQKSWILVSVAHAENKIKLQCNDCTGNKRKIKKIPRCQNSSKIQQKNRRKRRYRYWESWIYKLKWFRWNLSILFYFIYL